MSLGSIPGAAPLAIRPNPYTTANDALRPQAPRPGAAPARPGSLGAPLGSPTLGQSATALPAEAPAGTDPELWSVLSSDERAFFAKASSLGPVTYGRAMQVSSAAPATSRGGRLDVRA